jgi:hypothetical protein
LRGVREGKETMMLLDWIDEQGDIQAPENIFCPYRLRGRVNHQGQRYRQRAKERISC